MLTVTKAQYVTIPDVNFRNALKTLYPTAFNGAGQMDTTKSVIINAQGLNVSNKNIQDLTGVQYFKNLYNLLCSNNQLTTLPTLPTINLSYLNCSYNQIAAISTTAANLSYLYCSHNLLSTLPNYTNTSGYGHIDCSYNLIGSISAIPNVAYFNCDNNLLTSLPALPIHIQKLFCNNNQLTSLPTLSKIQTSVDTALVISCFGNQIYCLPKLPSGPLNFYSKLVVDTSMIKCLPNLPNTVNWQHQVVGTLDIFTSDRDSFGIKLPKQEITNAVSTEV